MERTEILCPECMKKKLLTSDNKTANCDNCGTEFIMLSSLTVKYTDSEEEKVFKEREGA